MRLVDQLERRGLVTRAADPIDRRRRIALTPIGRKLVEQATSAVQRAEEQYLNALSATERRGLADLLQRLLESHSQPSSVVDRA